MRPTSAQLARREMALAAAMGIASPNDFGADFGSEPGGEYYGYNTDSASGFGADAGFGTLAGFGADALAAPSASVAAHHIANPMHPAHAAATRAVLAKHHRRGIKTEHRENLLHPNKGSDVDVERYDFSLSQALVLGTALAQFPTMNIQPAVTVRPQRCVFGAPSLGFAIISSILIANVNALVGGSTDAGIYGPGSFGVHLDLPTLTPANRLTINGSYTGLTPPGFPAASPFLFVASFQCPATVVA